MQISCFPGCSAKSAGSREEEAGAGVELGELAQGEVGEERAVRRIHESGQDDNTMRMV